jgi:hypothetical protein
LIAVTLVACVGLARDVSGVLSEAVRSGDARRVCEESAFVDFLDYSELVDFDGQPQLYQIVGDGHPSARTYQEVARRLARDLGIDDPGDPS